MGLGRDPKNALPSHACEAPALRGRSRIRPFAALRLSVDSRENKKKIKRKNDRFVVSNHSSKPYYPYDVIYARLQAGAHGLLLHGVSFNSS